MQTSYDTGIGFVFTQEGGYTNDPKDPGGATNFGITIHDARAYWKPTATPEDVRSMPKAVAADIYRKHYATPICFDDIAPGLDVFTLDSAVNSGVGRANIWLGKAIGSPAKDYPTLAKQSKAVQDIPAAIKTACDTRLGFLQSLKTWDHFKGGWSKRVSRLRALCLRLALQATGKPTSEVQTELAKEVAASKAKTTTAAPTVATATTASTATVYHFWHWDILHVLIGVALIALAVFLIRNVVRHIHDASALEAEITTLENLG